MPQPVRLVEKFRWLVVQTFWIFSDGNCVRAMAFHYFLFKKHVLHIRYFLIRVIIFVFSFFILSFFKNISKNEPSNALPFRWAPVFTVESSFPGQQALFRVFPYVDVTSLLFRLLSSMSTCKMSYSSI